MECTWVPFSSAGLISSTIPNLVDRNTPHNFRMVQIKLFLLFAVATIAPVLARVHPLARCVSSSFVLLLITRYLLQAILSSREDTNLLGSAFSRRFFNGDRVVL